MRHVVLIFLLFLGFAGNAQEKHSVAFRLRKAYRLAYAEIGNLRKVKSAISGIKEDDITSESDSTRYYFYYLTAGILNYEERKTDLQDRYIDEAIALREKSIGILSPEYLELLWAKACNLIDGGNNDEAMRPCQKGLVVGRTLIERDYTAVEYWYGCLMQLLGDLYVDKGWHNQVVSLYNESFDILQNHYEEDDPTSWLPLLSLSVYYFCNGMYQEAYDTDERIGEYLRVNGGERSYYYGSTYKFQRALALGLLGRAEEADKTYREGTELLLELGAPAGERLSYKEDLCNLYSSWLSMLVEYDMFQKAADVAQELSPMYANLRQSIYGSVTDKTLEFLKSLEKKR